MKSSQEINEVTKALIAFQGQVPHIPLNAINPFFKSKYADLAGIIKIVKPVLAKNGLGLTQLVDYENDNAFIRTVLIHESGQYIESQTFYNTSGKPQEQGSAITYMRRYSIAGILGIVADDDDDGNVASTTSVPSIEAEAKAQGATAKDIEKSKEITKETLLDINAAILDPNPDATDIAIESIAKARGQIKDLMSADVNKIKKAIKELEEKKGIKI
tara:strand:+ start:3632 stop:4279 length:648 start_codon:yes stop_codon:yes gene_type:complete